jgi:hypothetical protein
MSNSRKKVTEPFTAAMFEGDTLTPEDAAWLCNYFVKFVKSGFDKKLFTDRFFRLLQGRFIFVSHEKKDDFWNAYFGNYSYCRKFLIYCRDYENPYLRPVEAALKKWIRGDYSSV